MSHEPGATLRTRVVRLTDADYPNWLARIHEPPRALWYRGRLERDEGERSVAIVGARAATARGLALARTLAADLAAAGLTIVSGLARGVDTAAHQGALDAGGRTVAVLGSGIDSVYPAENLALAGAITRTGGAVVSEFPPETQPWKGNFPRRNRTIAGWARAVVVVEAGIRSGALITVRAALEEGRDVLAVPGHPSVPSAAGTNALLRDGAALVRDAADVLAELGLPLARSGGAPGAERGDELLGSLPRGVPTSLEQIAAVHLRPLPQLLAQLTELELAGRLRRVAGGLFVRQ